VISSIVCEGTRDAAEQAAMAREAGAKALGRDAAAPLAALRLPPRPRDSYFEAIASVGLDLVAHVYPAWTRASYSSATLADLARLPQLPPSRWASAT
jgi:4-hydroxy-tetrahydrodipicolinate synthase